MKVKLVVLFTSLLTLGACATVTLTPEETVQKRAQERLDALVDGDFAAAYSYATPAYRKGVSLAAHKPKFAGAASWTNAVVNEVVCELDVCDVKTSISYNIPRLKVKNTRPMNERWIRVDGEWWIYHK